MTYAVPKKARGSSKPSGFSGKWLWMNLGWYTATFYLQIAIDRLAADVYFVANG